MGLLHWRIYPFQKGEEEIFGYRAGGENFPVFFVQRRLKRQYAGDLVKIFFIILFDSLTESPKIPPPSMHPWFTAGYIDKDHYSNHQKIVNRTVSHTGISFQAHYGVRIQIYVQLANMNLSPKNKGEKKQLMFFRHFFTYSHIYMIPICMFIMQK